MLNKSNDDELINARLEQIIEVIENSDKDSIKAMFSDDARDEAEDIDGGIERLFNLFPDGIDSWSQISSHTSENQNHGQRDKSIGALYNVYVGDKKYWFFILERFINTENPKEIGLFSIMVVDDRKKEPYFPSAGIFIAVE